ncbi:hypothetical protein AOLI_G00234910 [Acnodon oligacanthus]
MNLINKELVVQNNHPRAQSSLGEPRFEVLATTQTPRAAVFTPQNTEHRAKPTRRRCVTVFRVRSPPYRGADTDREELTGEKRREQSGAADSAL